MAPFTVVCPAAESSAVALPLAVNPTLAVALTFSPSKAMSLLAVTEAFAVASSLMLPFAFRVISLAELRVIPLLSRVTVFLFWSDNLMDFPSSFISIWF